MKPRILRYAPGGQTYFLPSAADEVWEPVAFSHRLLNRLALLLEIVDGVPLTPIRCLILACIGRDSGLGVPASRLSRQLSIPRATLAYHVSILRHGGLIYSKGPGPHDKRRERLVLTHHGARTLDRAAELLVELTAGGEWPHEAPRRSHWNLRRIPPDSDMDGRLADDPYPGVSTRKPPRARSGAGRALR